MVKAKGALTQAAYHVHHLNYSSQELAYVVVCSILVATAGILKLIP